MNDIGQLKQKIERLKKENANILELLYGIASILKKKLMKQDISRMDISELNNILTIIKTMKKHSITYKTETRGILESQDNEYGI